EFPFAAAIQTQTSTGQYFCGGALVNTLFIVTSGSCVDGATLFSIRLGITSLAEAGQRLATDKYVLHPLYNIDTLENDIGVIELRLPVSFTDYIQPIGLPGRDVQDNAVAIAIGWGQISDADAGLTNQL
ncbi:trypsin-like serine protease, partial [Staphylococcus aureus]